MNAFKYFMKTKRSFVHAICTVHCRAREGLLPEHSVGVKEAQGTKTAEVNARTATADHDRQGQAAHRQSKSHIVFELASGKSMHNRHS